MVQRVGDLGPGETRSRASGLGFSDGAILLGCWMAAEGDEG
jgi:hypothetical protein